MCLRIILAFFLYLNLVKGTPQAYTSNIATADDPTRIGKLSGDYFDGGSIDEVRIYNRALDESGILNTALDDANLTTSATKEVLKNYKHGKSKHSN